MNLLKAAGALLCALTLTACAGLDRVDLIERTAHDINAPRDEAGALTSDGAAVAAACELAKTAQAAKYIQLSDVDRTALNQRLGSAADALDRIVAGEAVFYEADALDVQMTIEDVMGSGVLRFLGDVAAGIPRLGAAREAQAAVRGRQAIEAGCARLVREVVAGERSRDDVITAFRDQIRAALE